MTELIELLGKLVEADRAARHSDRPRRVDSFLLVFSGGRYQIIGHPEWDERSDAPSEFDVDDLADRGWVRITGWDGKQRNFAVTAEGRAAWDEHVEQLQPEPDAARVTLDWPSPEPALRQIFDAYGDRGAPRRGVDVFVMAQAKEPDDRDVFNAYVRELARFGYLDVGWLAVRRCGGRA
jgi:hypothetical protein